MSEHHSGSHWGTGAGDASDIGGREEAGVMDTLRAALQDALAGSGEARQSSSEEGRDEACRAGGEEDSDEVGGAGGAGGGEVQGTEAALRVTRWMERASGKGGGPPPQLAFRTSSAKWVAFVAELTEADGSVLRQPLAGAGAALLLALLVEAELADAALLTQLLGAHSPEAAAMLTGLPPPVDEDPEDRHASARSRLLDTLVQIRSFMPRDMQAAPLLAGSLLPPAADRTTGAWRLALSIDATGSLLQDVALPPALAPLLTTLPGLHASVAVIRLPLPLHAPPDQQPLLILPLVSRLRCALCGRKRVPGAPAVMARGLQAEVLPLLAGRACCGRRPQRRLKPLAAAALADSWVLRWHCRWPAHALLQDLGKPSAAMAGSMRGWWHVTQHTLAQAEDAGGLRAKLLS